MNIDRAGDVTRRLLDLAAGKMLRGWGSAPPRGQRGGGPGAQPLGGGVVAVSDRGAYNASDANAEFESIEANQKRVVLTRDTCALNKNTRVSICGVRWCCGWVCWIGFGFELF